VAGTFVALLLLTAPLRGESASVILGYVGLLAVLLAAWILNTSRPTWAGVFSSLGPFGLVTWLTAERGGVTCPSGMVAYLTLVVLAALSVGMWGAFVQAALGAIAIGFFVFTGPSVPTMSSWQIWLEIVFQLFAVAFIASAALRAIGRAAAQAASLEAEEIRTRQAREEFELRVRHSKSLEALGRLTGGVAHDFNNMLTVIRSESELLQESWVSPEVREGLGRIDDATARASELTAQLLAVGRRQVLAPKVLSPSSSISGLHPFLSRLLPNGIELVLKLAADTGNVRADESRLEQVLINLVINASDAMLGGGRITILSRNVVLNQPEASITGPIPPGDYVELSVEDTGIGMAPDTLNRIFEPFFTTKGMRLGTGLGLATVQGIVAQCHGYVDVKSELGVGSTFRILLPRTTDEVEARARGSSSRLRRSAHILVVEDEDEVREATQRALESLGHKVVVAANDDEALALFETTKVPFEVAVVDVVMPGRGGRALATDLLALQHDLRVLFVSGYGPDQFPASNTNGTIGFLQKPLSRAALGAKVLDLLD
jgi:two-component system, cell cycle sensor histidine kinase and response regulator CckA